MVDNEITMAEWLKRQKPDDGRKDATESVVKQPEFQESWQ